MRGWGRQKDRVSCCLILSSLGSGWTFLRWPYPCLQLTPLKSLFPLTFILKTQVEYAMFPPLSMESPKQEYSQSIHSVLISTAETLKPCGPKRPNFIDEETHKAIKATDVFESLILCLPGFVIPMFQSFQLKDPLPIKAYEIPLKSGSYFFLQVNTSPSLTTC